MKRDPNIEAYQLLRGFVPEFRDFVKCQLVVRYGAERWLDGVPNDVRQQLTKIEQKWREIPWVEVRAESPLDFSYEEDLVRIVTDDNNWKKVFRQFFAHRDVIALKLREIKWIRDQVAHFRVVDRDQAAKLKGLCGDVRRCIARSAAIQANSEAPERFLSPDELLAGDKEPAELVASAQERAALAEGGDAEPMTDEQLAALRAVLLDVIFEQAADPDESHVEATRIHWRFNEWNRAPETEVLAWQVYAPSEPVSVGSKVYLAIRYNPAALNARAAVKRKAKPQFNSRARHGRCIVRGPSGERQETFVVDSEDWAYVVYKPRRKGKHEIVWAQESGGKPRRNPWVRREFEVE